MVDMGVIPHDDIEIYEYGLEQGIVLLYNFLTTVIIGAVMGMLWQAVVFIICYSTLRTFAGGYHARTPLRCYLFSIVMIALVLKLMEYVGSGYILSLGLLAFPVITALVLIPVADVNKPLYEYEVVKYRRKALYILAVEVLLSLGFLFFGYEDIAMCISISVATVMMMLILGYVNNRFVHNPSALRALHIRGKLSREHLRHPSKCVCQNDKSLTGSKYNLIVIT